jgi:hypothetical protein
VGSQPPAFTLYEGWLKGAIMEIIPDDVWQKLSSAQKQQVREKHEAEARAPLENIDGGSGVARGSEATIAKGLPRHRQGWNQASRRHRKANGGTQSST